MNTMRPGRPLGRQAYHRRNIGRPVTGRPALAVASWQRLRTMVLVERAGRACEFCGCRKGPIDPHHVVARSHGGADTWDNLIALCRVHHDMVSAPYEQHRMLITPSGLGQFLCRIVAGTKAEHDTRYWRVVGRAPTAVEQRRLERLYAPAEAS